MTLSGGRGGGAPGGVRGGEPQRVLIVQLRRLGDVTLSTALLPDLHRAWPTAALDWLVASAAAPLLEHHPLVSERLVLEKPHAVRLWRPVRGRRYDCVIDVQSSVSTAGLTWLSGAPVRVGWDARGRGWAYTHPVERRLRQPVYVPRDRGRMLTALGLPLSEPEPRLYLTLEERAEGAKLVRALAGARPCVGIVLTTSNAAKDWAAEKFAAVARALSENGVAAVVFRTPDGASRERAFHAAAGDAALFAPVTPVRSLLALIASSDVFLSGDTGPAHMATAVGVPRVTVYGPSLPEEWTPDSPMAVGVRDRDARCVACARSQPDGAHTCLEALDPSTVLAPVRDLLHRFRSPGSQHNGGGAGQPSFTTDEARRGLHG